VCDAHRILQSEVVEVRSSYSVNKFLYSLTSVINPYFTYSIAFLLSTLVYQLDWSSIYPSLSPMLLIFLVLTSLLAAFFGLSVKKKNTPMLLIDKSINLSTLIKITCICYLAWSLEFAYSQYIPLFEVIKGVSYSHTDFTGIPTLHTIAYTFQEFICIYIFHSYISNKNKLLLYLYFLNLLPFAAIFSRAALIFVFMSCLLIYITIVQSRTNLVKILKILLTKMLPIVLIISFMFGFAGNLRSTSQFGGNSDAGNDLAVNIGEATPSFYQSGLSQELYWLYLYTSSPLANLQENINVVSSINRPLEFMDMINFVINELTPDFISKRIVEVFDMRKTANYLINPILNVSTIYSGSFFHLQWFGMLSMFLFLMLFPIAYFSMISQQSQFQTTGIAMLSSLYFLLIFDNMFAFSGTSLTIIYPIVFSRFFDLKKKPFGIK
jgi:hypothetical protein